MWPSSTAPTPGPGSPSASLVPVPELSPELKRELRLSANAALAELLAGNERFAAGQPHYGHHVSAAAAASGGQRPFAVVLGCIDSRVPLEAVFDQNFGAICVTRSGGQVLDQAVLGSIEFAVSELGVPLVLVLGHERCGAVAASIEAARTGAMPVGPLGYLVEQITPAIEEAAGALDPQAPEFASLATRLHVANLVQRLATLPSVLAGGGAVGVAGAVYDLDTARVKLLG